MKSLRLLELLFGLLLGLFGWCHQRSSSSWQFQRHCLAQTKLKHGGFGPFNSNQVVGILGVLFILLVTFLASRGIDKIAKVATFGGIFAFGITILFSLFSIIVLIAHHGVLAQGITGIKSFTTSPNHNFQSPIAIISFLVYAIFA